MTREEFVKFAELNMYREDLSGRWSCHICPFSSASQQDTKRHLEAKHVILPPVACEICFKQFKTKESLRYHLRSHNKTQDFA